MTKKLLFLLAVSAVLFSCNKNGYTITGTVKGVDGKKIVLEKPQENLGISIPVDTAKIENGKFTFEGKITEPAIYQISIEGERNKSFLIVENGEINIQINKDSIFLNKISGTYNNEQLTEFNAADMKIQRKVMDFQNANRDKMKTAMAAKDTATINKLRDEYKVLMEGVRTESLTFRDKYIQEHPKALISALLIQGLANSPTADVKKLEGYFNNLDASLKKSSVGKKIEKQLAEMKTVTVGRRAPDFTAPDLNGKKVSLNESIGAVTIIDFWASWCPGCRQENPNLVALYKEYHSKGLNIIGVSLDKDAADWKTAIEKDQLAWTQVSNLKKWDDPIAKTYGVEALPATYVLNQYGVVVGKDLSGAKLKEKIDILMKNVSFNGEKLKNSVPKA